MLPSGGKARAAALRSEALLKRSETRWVALISLVFTYAFFFEYLPPFKIAHIPYDLDGYHYPLLDYAFRSLRQGIFPLWDAAIYCGISMVGNPQVGLFYPPTWLLFAVNAGQERLQYWTVEVLMILHVWLGFMLCFFWLRWRGVTKLACAFGAGIFAFSGYMMLQLQHYGLACGYAWMPLGLWAIDEAASSRDWRPLWKLALASAFCCLAGYTPTWFVFWAVMGAYALGSKHNIRTLLMTAGALAFSVVLAMVQILPAMEAASMKTREVRYGTGLKNPEFYASYFVPNYYDFGMDVAAFRYGEYLYLGAPAFFGLAYWLVSRRFKETLPAMVMLTIVLIMVTNPFALRLGNYSAFKLNFRNLPRLVLPRRDNTCDCAAGRFGFECFPFGKSQDGAPMADAHSNWGSAAWPVRLLSIWWPEGAEFASGWRSAEDAAVFLVLFTLGVLLLRCETGRRRVWLSAVLLLAAGADYKAFGTTKRFNARWGKYDKEFRSRFPRTR